MIHEQNESYWRVFVTAKEIEFFHHLQGFRPIQTGFLLHLLRLEWKKLGLSIS
jgi:hypothetical protein